MREWDGDGDVVTRAGKVREDFTIMKKTFSWLKAPKVSFTAIEWMNFKVTLDRPAAKLTN